MEPEGQDDVSAPLKLDLDVLAALVAIALVAAVVAELEPQHARRSPIAAVAMSVAIALVAAVVAEHVTRAPARPAPWWWSPSSPRSWWPRRSTSTCSW